jgi:hypothetical protein
MNTPGKRYEIGDVVSTPAGKLPVLDIIPLKFGSETRDWLYCFGDDPEEKFTTEELNTKRCARR